MKSFRNSLKWALPAVVVFMAGSLILSRVIKPDPEPAPEVSIEAHEASDYAGSFAEVCGLVVQATHATNIGGNPVFLNFGDVHPNQDFTVVIWERYHRRWDRPIHPQFEGQPVCVEGEIRMHEGRPQIEVNRPENVRIMLH